MSADFPNYLQSVCNAYQRWWELYTITDVEGSKTAQRQNSPSLFDFGLMVETVQAKQQERGDTPEKIEPKTERLPVQEGLLKYAQNHVLLVGKPGSGKSTALARLLLEEAQKARSPLNPPEDRGATLVRGFPPLREVAWEEQLQSKLPLERGEEQLQLKPPFLRGVPQAGGSHFGRLDQIPVLVELRQYRTSVVDLIRDFLRRHKLRLESADIETLLDDGQFLLLVDGVNELPNEEARRDLKTFRQNYPNTLMIFTTRDLSVGGDLGIEKKLEMQPLTEEQMQQFVRAYLPEQGEEMLRRLGERLREFGQTPLLLWMLCELFRKTGNVPPNLGLVFRCFAQSYDGKIKDDVPVSGESRRWWQELLQHLAFKMMQGKTPTELRVTIDKREAQAIFEKFLQGKVDYPASRVKEWLEDLLKHHLIQVASNQKIEFRHQLLQEYYAAECLLQQLPNISNDKLKRDYLNYLKWTEPLALMLALQEKEAQAVQVVELALDVDLQLGARLAGEVKREFQEKTVGLILGLEVPELLKIEFLGITRSECAIAFLSYKLQHKDFSVRRNAADALGEIRDSQAVQALIAALSDQDSSVRRSAARALGKIRDSQAVQVLIAALSDQDSFVRTTAVFMLGEIGDNQAVEALVTALNHEDSNVRVSAALELGKIGDTQAVEALVTALNHEDSDVHVSAACELGKIGDTQAVEALVTALNHKGSDMRRSAAYALGEIGDTQAVKPLIAALNDKDSSVRGSAARALGKIRDTQAVQALITTLKDEDSFVRRLTAYALGKIGGSQAVQVLITALKDEDSYVCATAADALGKIENPQAVQALIAALNDKDSYMRRRAADALGEIKDTQAVQALILALNDQDSSVRSSAANALGKIKDTQAVQALILALNDQDSSVRSSATDALGKTGGSQILSRMWKLRLTEIYDTKNVILKIQEHCKFYNHKIFHSPPVEEETKIESQTSKSSTYIFHQRVGNVNTGDVNIHGNQVGIEHNQLKNQD